jgi:hypothetical protein
VGLSESTILIVGVDCTLSKARYPVHLSSSSLIVSTGTHQTPYYPI